MLQQREGRAPPLHFVGSSKYRLPGAGRGAAFKADAAPCTILRQLVGEGVDDSDVRVDLDGNTAESRGAITPLSDGVERGLDEE